MHRQRFTCDPLTYSDLLNVLPVLELTPKQLSHLGYILKDCALLPTAPDTFQVHLPVFVRRVGDE